MRAFRVFLRGLLGLLFLLLVLTYIRAGDIYDYQDTFDGVHLPPVDAIVCLAGGRGRIAAAADVWYRYWEKSQGGTEKGTPILYISGMGHQSNWHVFSKQLRRGVSEVIEPDDVILETESENTETNARWLARYSRQKGWHRVLLITSRYHMKRAKWIFDQIFSAAGHPLEIETLSVYQEPFEPGEWRSSLHGIRVTLWEYIKEVAYLHFWKP